MDESTVMDDSQRVVQPGAMVAKLRPESSEVRRCLPRPGHQLLGLLPRRTRMRRDQSPSDPGRPDQRQVRHGRGCRRICQGRGDLPAGARGSPRARLLGCRYRFDTLPPSTRSEHAGGTFRRGLFRHGDKVHTSPQDLLLPAEDTGSACVVRGPAAARGDGSPCRTDRSAAASARRKRVLATGMNGGARTTRTAPRQSGPG